MRRRRRSLVLVPAALLSAACTRTRSDDKVAEDALSRDLTLATQMENKPVDPSRPEAAGGGGVCAAQPVPAAPSQARRAEAVSLAQRAQQAEVVGDTRAARELFARAAQLDGTDKDVVYHLARADEALGRTSDAAREYCQYLSLVPTGAGAAEANARLASLGAAKKPAATVAAQGSSTHATWRSPAPTHVAYSSPRTAGGGAQQVASARSTSQSSPDVGATRTVVSGEAAGHRASGAPDAGASAPAVDTTTAIPPEAVVASTPTQPAATTPARRSGGNQQHVARDAAIGAAAGAAVGGIMTHSVKGAGIGAIAGGLLGAVSGRAGSGGFRTPGYAR
ncbi:MAG TPA: YMGG-like glycine zipper-containing protein [Gemmatimonadaceae bacterium]|nr:YMGG-like glycine zipper-containing protein [Gemmatimonadaceae bacterium]